nr:unnamed protein product [Callosobruchus analis]
MNNEQTLEFIEDYRSYQYIHSKLDKNKNKRNDAYRELSEKYNLNEKAVMNKKKSLRSYFSKEHQKVLWVQQQHEKRRRKRDYVDGPSVSPYSQYISEVAPSASEPHGQPHYRAIPSVSFPDPLFREQWYLTKLYRVGQRKSSLLIVGNSIYLAVDC